MAYNNYWVLNVCFVVLSVKQGRITKYKRYKSPTGEWAEHGVDNEQGQDCIWDGGNGVGQENHMAALRKKRCHHRINTYINIMS